VRTKRKPTEQDSFSTLEKTNKALPAREKPLDEHLPQLVHCFWADAAGLLDLLREPDGERVGLEADFAFFTELKIVVHLVDDVLGERIFQVILEQGGTDHAFHTSSPSGSVYFLK
jgi:hypothetical protein